MSTSSTDGEVAAGPRKLPSTMPAASFLALPTETQRETFAHCSQGDLICLALVSKHFHALASAQLYRNFHIIFPDDDDVNFDSPIDGLAGGLDTFTTSQYNYAKHLRDLSMDTLSAGRKGEKSYRAYLYKASCGKFLNTLIHLTLKRARSLESFRWNIRVELSRPVYAQLHSIRTLKRLHIRLQAGDSYYMPPPPLPASTDSDSPSQPPGYWPETNQNLPSYGPSTSASVPPGGHPPLGASHSFSHHSSRPSQKSTAGNKGTRTTYPPTLSGFKDLKSLSVLEIDNLNIVGELQTCIKNSFFTLKDLQLSLSDGLAQRARKSAQDSDADDSDLEDDLHVAPQSDNAVDYNGTGAGEGFCAQEERKVQEAILARIFGMGEHPLVKKSPLHFVNGSLKLGSDGNLEAAAMDSENRSEDPRSEFVQSLKTASARLMTAMNGSRNFSISQQEVLEVIEKAARKYVDSKPKPAGGADEAEASGSSVVEGSCNSEMTTLRMRDECATEEMPASSTANLPSLEAPSEVSPPDSRRRGEPHHSSRYRSDSSPDDIVIEHLESTQDHLDEFRDEPSADPAKPQTPPTTLTSLAQQRQSSNEMADFSCHGVDNFATKIEEPPAHGSSRQDDCKTEFETVKVDRDAITQKLIHLHRLVRGVGRRVLEVRDQRLSDSTSVLSGALDSELALLNRSAVEVANEMRILESEIEDLVEKPTQHHRTVDSTADSTADSTKQSIEAYKRKTRGMSVESLKICLIPVKASVLSQAIDVSCIRELTLINVGNQAPVWSMLSKEQKNRPLALRSVFTDHVSASFLTCMAQLPVLDDLFMLDRGPKHKPESFAPRSASSMDQIRRLVLKKHMPRLKRLMIKDDTHCPTWDANEKTMILICTRGVQLEELALSMNIHAVHAFMQYFSGLVKLRALSILHFKNNDTCIWVMRELFRFIVDNLSHHPELKLEWIATEDDRVDRVIRPCESVAESPSKEAARRAKDKGKDKAHGLSSSVASEEYPVLPVDAIESDSDSEDDGMDSGSRLKFKTIGPLQFYDVWGVKIFEKEIRSGKL